MRCIYFTILLTVGFILFILQVKSEKKEPTFYELLDVPTNADTKTIRKAFKKLALTMHPDKNKVKILKI